MKIKNIHLIGLASDGGVHFILIMFALAKIAENKNKSLASPYN